MKQLVTVLPLLGILLIGHQFPQAKLRLRSDQKAMKREILKHIPIGTRIEDAQAMMETSGFKCVNRNNSSFAEMDLKGPVGQARSGLDFLRCDLEVPVTEYCARRYQIAIVHKEGVVTEVLVSVGASCA